MRYKKILLGVIAGVLCLGLLSGCGAISYMQIPVCRTVLNHKIT